MQKLLKLTRGLFEITCFFVCGLLLVVVVFRKKSGIDTSDERLTYQHDLAVCSLFLFF